ncbi:MAG TPA: NAD(P)/FAD-dependent oxidoreductase [Acidimicrobiia bacterium]|nr:NAD(P)/FAD-dependent oxidoreductase [Acidimicrobiia bacterium]
MLDVVVVGAGPNGLTAAAALASDGRSVHVVEAAATIGGGTKTEELTLPGFRHDVCSAIHPLGAASPAFAALGLERHGLRWIHPTIPLAHPLDDGTAVVLHRSIDETALGLGGDAAAYRKLVGPLADHWEQTRDRALDHPLRSAFHPVSGLRLGRRALPSATFVVRRFEGDRARALLAGLAAHAIAPLHRWGTAGVGVVLGAAAHAGGWPIAAGGSQTIADALAAKLASDGGTVETDRRVGSLDELPEARAVLLDTAPAAAVAIAGDRMPRRIRKRMMRFRHGAGSFKLDLVLDGPIPWTAEAARHAGTVHVGGTFEEIAEGEQRIGAGEMPERPFVLVAQQSRFDPSRTPDDREAVWAYCHVPAGWDGDATDAVLDQIERFAPGFRDRIVATHVMGPGALEEHNPNYVGGDIAGGEVTLASLLFRPRPAIDPYRIGDGIWLCSSSTPPGAGVHGMCGWHAASSVGSSLG